MSRTVEKRLVEKVDGRYKAARFTARSISDAVWSELAGLERSHFDPLRRQVRTVGTIECDRGSYRYTEETKTNAGRRTTKMPTFLVEIFALHLRDAPPSKWLFSALGGGFLRYDNWRPRVWAPAVRRAGLDA